MGTNLSRRNFLINSLLSTGSLALALPATRALAHTCGFTPKQTAGPFYPGDENFRQENDLTRVNGRKATGQVIYIEGIVRDSNCLPLKGARVEIWQACHSGKYNHREDPNPAKLDPNFKYWGETNTDENGAYIFKTILPGSYPASDTWTRPPHIHYRVNKLGYEEMVTQLYFAGQKLNEKDAILRQVPVEKRASVITDLKPSAGNRESGSLSGRFDLTLKMIQF